ncbi:MAG: glycolate oxidase subunit GlcE [Halofilum sp. (in: g-proteobacteria)]|nr:glycolate oxidase subunit GlcE [Halofilum sp. (in: g-proteobacteria)]
MTSDADHSRELAERVRAAAAAGTPLALRGGGTKDFYGHPVAGEPLDIRPHRGVLSYEPTELMLTARAGTPLEELETLLADNGQMLAFEPPRVAPGGTLGGAIAAGLSGPRRPFTGAVRDHVLGVRIVDGNGAIERFGGEVIKNVAGYDLSRLTVGALGTLGAVLDVSLKVLPRPEAERSLCLELAPGELFARVERALRDGAPVTGAAHDGERAWLRLSGAASAVDAGARTLGGDTPLDDSFWGRLRDHALTFLADEAGPLWRISLPPGSAPPELPGPAMVDWAGQLFWLRTEATAAQVRAAAAAAGGHATLFRGGDGTTPVFTPLEPVVARLHRRLKRALDPAGVLNRGRLYPDF